MSELKDIYFIGIGGIGMSAIARYYNHAGYRVSGYDLTPSKLTANLEAEGIDIHYEDDINRIPKDIESTFVIYTPAIPPTLKELQYVEKMGYRLCKRSRALGEIAADKDCFAIAGTHGKTTTSTLLAHIFQHSGEGCSAFLGGISKNYQSNLILSKGKNLVAEADEFDRSFLQLFPKYAAITSVDADHLDIYNDYNTLNHTFTQFASQVKSDGAVIVNINVDIDLSPVKARVYRYSYDKECDFYASEIKLVDNGYFDFTINFPGGKIEHCTIGIPGWINVENAIAAFSVVYLEGISPEKIKEALRTYEGVERRFDIRIKSEKVAYVDDYAHHPNEISASISSIRNIFPGRKVCGIFQPHLYSRTKDFAPEFAKALSALDELILLDIYPARELPIPGVTSSIIFDKVELENKVLIKKEELMEELKHHDIDVLVTLGAGNIDRFIPLIEDYLEKNV